MVYHAAPLWDIDPKAAVIAVLVMNVAHMVANPWSVQIDKLSFLTKLSKDSQISAKRLLHGTFAYTCLAISAKIAEHVARRAGYKLFFSEAFAVGACSMLVTNNIIVHLIFYHQR
ncbi:MAG: hypothetical protein JSR58_02230 [Verrucomicrobia bacterium]|nr:hypothetical protein [Verrucomicrobiota bacterium]